MGPCTANAWLTQVRSHRSLSDINVQRSVTSMGKLYLLLQNAPFCSQIFKIFFASGGKGALTPLTTNQNPCVVPECSRNSFVDDPRYTIMRDATTCQYLSD